MKNRVSVSSSGPFLIELLIGLAIFALAAAICVQVFVGANQISKESSNLNNAMLKAQIGAELFKASNGDLREMQPLLHMAFEDPLNVIVSSVRAEVDEVKRFFDSNWQHITVSDDTEPQDLTNREFALKIRRLSSQLGYVEGEVVVSDMSGNVIFALNVAALEVRP